MRRVKAGGGSRSPFDGDADGERGDRHLPVEDADAAVLQDAAEHAVLQEIEEIGDIHARLHADEVVGGKTVGELAMLGDCQERLRRRHGDVQEEPDRVLHAEPAQLQPERDQVVVVHPDRVVGVQQRAQRAGEAAVHLEIGLIVAGLELRDVEARVEDGPQHDVRVAEIVGFVFAAAQGERGDPRAADLGDARRGAQLLALLADLAAPAEPQPVARAQDVGDGDHNAARLARPIEVGHAVRDEDDAAHGAPSGCFD